MNVRVLVYLLHIMVHDQVDVDIITIESSSSTSPLSTLIKTLCHSSNQIRMDMCSMLSKTDFIDIVESDVCGQGRNKVTKSYLYKNIRLLSDTIEDVNTLMNPIFKCETLSGALDDILGETKLTIDSNQIVTNFSKQVSDNSVKLNSITNQLKTLSEAIDNFTMGAGPRNSLSSSEAPLRETDTPIDTAAKPVSHSFKCINENFDNFILTDESDKLLDFLSKVDFRSEGGHEVATYGAKYNYMGHKSQPKPLPECLQSLMDKLNQTKTGGTYELNACLVNRYEGPESKLPEHSDNEYSINPSSDIFTVSLGDVRKVIFRDIFSDKEMEHTPQANSLYVMSRDSQNFYQHRIDRDSSFTGVRYSLTFRSVHWRYLNSTCIIGDSNTKNIKFGSGKGTVGDATPGKQVYAPLVEDIDAKMCASYRNTVISVGVNSIKDKNITMNDIKDIYSIYKTKISEIERLNKECKILVVPLFPSKLISLNRKIIRFNRILLNDLPRSFESVSIVGGTAQFVDKESGLLSESLSRYRDDPIHLNSAGVGLLVSKIKFAIFQKKQSSPSKIHSDTPYSSAVSRRPP